MINRRLLVSRRLFSFLIATLPLCAAFLSLSNVAHGFAWIAQQNQGESQASEKQSALKRELSQKLLKESFQLWQTSTERDPEFGDKLILKMIRLGELAAALECLEDPELDQLRFRSQLLRLALHERDLDLARKMLGDQPALHKDMERWFDRKFQMSHGLARIGKIESALEYANGIPDELRMPPDNRILRGSLYRTRSFHAVVQKLVETGELDRAIEIANSASNPNEETLRVLKIAETLALAQQLESAVKFLEESDPAKSLSRVGKLAVRLARNKQFDLVVDLLQASERSRQYDPEDQQEYARIYCLAAAAIHRFRNEEIFDQLTADGIRMLGELESVQDSTLYVAARLLVIQGDLEHAARMIANAKNEVSSKSRFDRLFLLTLVLQLRNESLSTGKAVQAALSLPDSRQKTEALETIVQHLIDVDDVEAALEIVDSEMAKLVDPNQLRTKYCPWFESEENFLGVIGEIEDPRDRNYRRFSRARHFIRSKRLSEAQALFLQMEGETSKYSWDKVIEDLGRYGFADEAVEVILKTKVEPIDREASVNELIVKLLWKRLDKQAVAVLNASRNLKAGVDDARWLNRFYRTQSTEDRVVSTMNEFQKLVPDSAQYDRILAWHFAKRQDSKRAIYHAIQSYKKQDLKEALDWNDLAQWGVFDELLVDALRSKDPNQIKMAIQLQPEARKDWSDMTVLESQQLSQTITRSGFSNKFQSQALYQLVTYWRHELELFDY